MGLEIVALILILLAKAQKGAGSLFGPPTPAAAANDAQAKAAQAAADAAAAAKAGDHATAAQKSAEANQHAQTAASAARAARTPPPWPQVLPGELPAFPGAGWHPASPVTGAMAARAWQLLAQLWEHGEGTWKAEKTGDRWVVYKAAQTSPGKKGVVAYTTAQISQPADSEPSAMHAQAPPQPGPQSQIVPASHTQAAASSGLPTLRPPPAAPARGPSVIALQQRLGVPQTGTYDGATIAAVHNFQLQHPETGDSNGHPDNIVGKKMWAALGFGSSQRAA